MLDFKYQLISVTKLEEDFITNSNTLIDNILYADSFVNEKAWKENAGKLGKRLRMLPKEDMNAWITWFQYAMQGMKKEAKDEFIEKIRNGDVRDMCNSFERVLNDVREEGIKEGIREERNHLVLNCHRKGKTLEEIAELVDIPLGEVRQIIGQCQVE